ncbi:unnamed protein product [Moneuplotes crassus]|uniref:Uncharacterized protein n=1 Tax=Euplotes crassus TaxID=5936 RepID=A0AAD1UE39_EUPCR|nr:unnamed protein product [Moneuplotes crassus]
MDNIGVHPHHLPDFTSKVLGVMQSKGVRRNILVELKHDQGFYKFCSEWISQRWDLEDIGHNVSTKDLIFELRNKIKSQEQLIDEWRMPHLQDVEKSLLLKSKVLKQDLLTIKTINICGLNNKFIAGPDLLFNPQLHNHWKLGKCVYFQYPSCTGVKLIFSQKYGRKAHSFFKNLFPRLTQWLKLFSRNRIDNQASLRNIGNWLTQVEKIAFRVTTDIHFEGFLINRRQLKRIFGFSANKKSLSLINCKIELDIVPDSAMAFKNCTIQILNIDLHWSNLNQTHLVRLEHFQNLINGLSQSEDLKESLQELYFSNTGLADSIVSDIIEVNQFSQCQSYDI